MKDYGKIKTGGGIEIMPNPYRVVVSNPSDEIKSKFAEIFDWLEMVYTDEPEYDPETQYLTQHWEEQNGKAVQVWEVHEIEPEEVEE